MGADLRAVLRSDWERRVHDSMATYSHATAAFYADKLVSLCGALPCHVLALARAHYFAGEVARALATLRAHRTLPLGGGEAGAGGWRGGADAPAADDAGGGWAGGDVAQCVFLAARCMEQTRQWAPCLDALALCDPELASDGPEARRGAAAAQGWDGLHAAVYCIAGRCNEGLERRQAAKLCYQRALAHDPYCYEAYDRLLSEHLIADGAKGERELWQGLRHDGEAGAVVHELFQCRLSCWSKRETLVPHAAAAADAAAGGADACTAAAGALSDADAEQPLLLPEERKLCTVVGWANPFVLHCRAERLYSAHHLHAAVECAERVYQMDPYHPRALQLYTACLEALKRKTKLFHLGHELVRRAPGPLAWFVVGCYYHCVADYERAGKFFSRATSLNGNFLEAWVAHGHTFHALEEGEHTMAAYRNAQRLFPGSHLPPLLMGMEHAKSANLRHAYSFLVEARELVTTDPMVLNEMGVVMYKSGHYESAARHFQTAVELSPVRNWTVRPGSAPANASGPAVDAVAPSAAAAAVPVANLMRDAYWEPCVYNLANALRKLRRFEEAVEYYHLALTVRPNSATILASLAFTYHLMLRLDDAINYYHQSLSLKSTDNFCRDMLERAMDEHFRIARPAHAAAGRSSYASSLATLHSAEASASSTMAVDGRQEFLSPSQLPHRPSQLMPQGTVLEDTP